MVNKSTIITQNNKQKNKKTYHTDETFLKSNRTMMVNKSTIIKQKQKQKKEQKKNNNKKQQTKTEQKVKTKEQKPCYTFETFANSNRTTVERKIYSQEGRTGWLTCT